MYRCWGGTSILHCEGRSERQKCSLVKVIPKQKHMDLWTNEGEQGKKVAVFQVQEMANA
jgi:hypothetical protein